MLLSLLAVPALAVDAAPAGPVTLDWDWSKPHRWYLESDVQLPMFMWFQTPFNHQARSSYFQLRVVTQCAPGTALNAKNWEVACTLEDVALSASPMAQEEGQMGEIVEELDQLLTGAVAQIQVRPDGKLVNLDLEGIDRRNQRGGQVVENLRLVLLRGFSAIDLELSKKGEAQWIEKSPLLMAAPAAVGTAGLAQVVHTVTGVDGVFVTLHSEGQGVMTPSGQVEGPVENRYDTRLVSEERWDTRARKLVQRSWTVVGTPTASSGIAAGAAGYAYLQVGRLVSLSEGQGWDVGQSREIPPQEAEQSAIQMLHLLGVAPSN